MKEFKVPQAVALVLLAGAMSATDLSAQTAAPMDKTQSAPQPTLAEVQIRTMLLEFLKGVPTNDPKVFDKFFADDVIYTHASGLTTTKAEMMKELNSGPPPEDPKVTYDAEDITVRQYGTTAILNFRLVQHTPGKPDARFRNTGTFLKRSGRWQVVAWQATAIAAADKKQSE